MSLSESPDGLKDFVMQVLRERRRLNLGKLPIYLSEWNNTPSQQDLLNDTCFKSCYIVKNILENYDRLESFTYQALTDLMADSSLPNMLFFGGLGLFTVNGIPKASYYAYTLLPVSYTHLDVYKRQRITFPLIAFITNAKAGPTDDEYFPARYTSFPFVIASPLLLVKESISENSIPCLLYTSS